MTDSRLDRHDASADRLLEALADEHRRTVLAELTACDDTTIGVDALSARLDSVPETALYHCHLPVLADAGLIAFDPDSAGVEYTPNADATDVLAVVDDRFE